MINRDYHNFSLDDALQDADNLIGLVRMDSGHEYVRFITGQGIIREKLLKYLQDYGLNPQIELHNPGSILVEVM